MLISELIGNRFKERPSVADIDSYAIMLKGGYIRQVSNGIFTLLTPALKVCQKIENIIRDEMNKIGGQEVLFPVVLPKELWEETKRYETVGRELLRFKDRTNSDYLLAMTHEEASVHLARSEATSYLKYPFMIYQIQTKFRDEPRSRGGLIRVREFKMKDAYSFHTSKESLDEFYETCFKSYERIFKKCGLKNFIAVGSDCGMMGGDVAHEFILISDVGEDSIVVCENCGLSANLEVAKSNTQPIKNDECEIKKIETKGINTIEKLESFLSIDRKNMIKTVIFEGSTSKKAIIVFIRADYDVNEAKLKNILKENITPFKDYEKYNLPFGYLGPYNFKEEDDFIVLYDDSIKNCNNMVSGAGVKDFHISGICVDRDLKIKNFVDVKKINENDKCINCGGNLKIKKGIEIGNIFKLGDKYTKSMKMTYIDKDGKSKTPIMGCYGIGIGRLSASIIEENHDDFGPIWPFNVAPFHIHICSLSNKKQSVLNKAKELYKNLSIKYDVILDDRELSAGIQFNDADLLGAPIRIILSPKNLENDKIEIISRDKKLKYEVGFEKIYQTIDEIKNKMENEY